MLRTLKPSNERISTFLEQQSFEALTYAPVGLSSAARAGFSHDHVRARIGEGELAFGRARDALAKWQQFPEWVSVFPEYPPLEVSRTVVVLARHFGFWSLNACRIVELFDGESDLFGFAYGTLREHAECGEERFLIELAADDSVWYEIRATSRPRARAARLAFPLARAVQARFRRDSVARIREAVKD
jgi:uncharacterized protein (UPF0548 family)